MLAGLIAAPRPVKTSGMETGRNPTLAEAIAAAQAWWREAGVDLDYAEEARSWLADPAEQAGTAARSPAPQAPAAPVAPARPEAARPRIGGDRAAWPQRVEDFPAWWMAESSLDFGGLGPRVPPRCAAGAPLMVLVPMPESDDAERLLSGPEGRLVAGFALAAGLDPDAIAIASALPRHMAGPDWAGLAAQGLGDVLLHLLSLAAPKRLLVLGRDILPLLGHDPAISAPGPGVLSIQGPSGTEALPILTHYAPARLLGHARLRSGLWRHWLDWTDGAG